MLLCKYRKGMNKINEINILMKMKQAYMHKINVPLLTSDLKLLYINVFHFYCIIVRTNP